MASVRVISIAVAATLVASASGWGTSFQARAAELPEPAVGGHGQEGDYLRLVHKRLHPGWVDGYIRLSPYKLLGPSNSKRQAELSIVIRWDGTVHKAEITKSSGLDEFDAAAMNAVLLAAPFPPPVAVMGDDGLVHLTWTFARNHRLCAGGAFKHVEYPLHVALPNLAARGQLSEALRRMRAQLDREGWRSDFVSPFVRQWLGRSHLNTELDARAAAALAAGGDRQQARALEAMLLVPQTAAIAAPALERLGKDVGALLTAGLAGGGEAAEAKRPAVLAALHALETPASSSPFGASPLVGSLFVGSPLGAPSAGSALARCAPCADLLAALIVDPSQPAKTRIEAINLLGRGEKSESMGQALARAAKDPDPGVRAAALLGQVAPGAGRGSLIRMAALLRDPSPELRAAGAAGVLRAGGDSGLEQLYLLAKDRDTRPLIAASGELARMSSEPSADLLRRLLKRPEKNVRAAVVAALALRRDETARALVNPILASARSNISEDAPIRQLALVAASPAELVAMSADTRLGIAGYRALLDAQLRPEAARWLLTNVEQLSEEDRITALGAWIAERPKITTTAKN